MKNEQSQSSQQNMQYTNMIYQPQLPLVAGQQSQSQPYLPSAISLNQTLNNELLKNGVNNPYSMYFTKRKDKLYKEKQQTMHNSSYQNLPMRPRQERGIPQVPEKVGSNFPNLRQSSTESFNKAKQRVKEVKYGHFKKGEKQKIEKEKKLQELKSYENIPDNHQYIGATNQTPNQSSLRQPGSRNSFSQSKGSLKGAVTSQISSFAKTRDSAHKTKNNYEQEIRDQNQKNYIEQLNIVGVGHGGQPSIPKSSMQNGYPPVDLKGARAASKNEQYTYQSTTVNNISNMSTNPSSSQIQVRGAVASDQQKWNSGHKFANSQKQLIVLKQKLVGNGEQQVTIKKLGYDAPQAVFELQQAQSQSLNQSQSSNVLTAKKPSASKIECIKNIYNQNQGLNIPQIINKDPNQENASNSYNYFQGKARSKNPFSGASRNSHISYVSAGAGHNAANGSLGGAMLGKALNSTSSMNIYCQNPGSHSNPSLNIRLQNNRQSHISQVSKSKNNSSHKNSKQNTKTSFGISNQKDQGHEVDRDILSMEVRGKSSSHQTVQLNSRLKHSKADSSKMRQVTNDTLQTEQASSGYQMGPDDSIDQEQEQSIDNLHQYFGLMQQKREHENQWTMQESLQSQYKNKNLKIQNSIIRKNESFFAVGSDIKKQNNSKSERKELKQKSTAQYNNDTQEIIESILKQAPFEDDIQETQALTAAQNTMEKPVESSDIKSNGMQSVDQVSTGIIYFQKQGKMIKKSQMKSQQQKSRQQKFLLPHNVNNSSSASRMLRGDHYRHELMKHQNSREKDSSSLHMQSLPQIVLQQNKSESRVQLKQQLFNQHQRSEFNNETAQSIDASSGHRVAKDQLKHDLQRAQNESQDVNMSLQEMLNPDDQDDFISNQNVYDAYGGQSRLQIPSVQNHANRSQLMSSENGHHDSLQAAMRGGLSQQAAQHNINVLESMSDIQRFQDNQMHNHKSFDHAQSGVDLDVSLNVINGGVNSSFINNQTEEYGVKASHTENRSLQDDQSCNDSPSFTAGAGSYSSIERMQRYEAQHNSMNRASKANRNTANQAQSDLLNQPPPETQLKRLNSNAVAQENRHQKGHDGIQLAPLHGVRDGFGNGPGTANTHGGVQRQNYKNTSQINMQYNLPSQQCQSEMYNMNNQYRNLENVNGFGMNNNFNLNSNFDESFDNLVDTPFQHLDALDPKEDVENIPSIHSITINRQQRSQATNRQNHQKVGPAHLKYHNAIINPHSVSDQNQQNNLSLCSKSESIANNQPQIREAQLQASQFSVSQLSSNEHLSDQKTTVMNKNNSYLSKRDTTSQDDSHPFNGPKLHLYRKGQSKSSQSKLRKIKVYQHNQSRLNEINSLANYSNIQQTGQDSIHNQFQGVNQSSNKQLSEGGAMYSIHKNKKIASKTKEGHINIQEILNAREQGINLLDADRMYTDVRSQNSHGYLSQNSNELGIHMGGIQSKDGFEHQNLLDQMDSSSQQQVQGQAQGSFDKGDPNGVHQGTNRGQDEKSEFSHLLNREIMAIETKSQQNPSQFSTIQQSMSKSNLEPQHDMNQHRGSNYNLPKLTPDPALKTGSRSVLLQQQIDNSLNSPYQVNSSCSQRLGALNQYPPAPNLAPAPIGPNSDILIQKIQEQQRQGMRPNTTNPTGPLGASNSLHNIINQEAEGSGPQQHIVNKTILRPLHPPGTSQNFQHPKVGKNSKHPQVFKNHGSLSQQKLVHKMSSSKNLSRQMAASSKLLNASQSGSNMNLDQPSDQSVKMGDGPESGLSAPKESFMRNYNSSGPPSTGKQQLQPQPRQAEIEKVVVQNLQTFNCSIDSKQADEKKQAAILTENKSKDNVKNHNFETTFENFNMLQEARQERNSSLEIERRPRANINIIENNETREQLRSSISRLNEFINEEIGPEEKYGVQRSSSFNNRAANLKSRQGARRDRKAACATQDEGHARTEGLDPQSTSINGGQSSVDAPMSSFSENVKRQKKTLQKQSSKEEIIKQDDPKAKNPQILESLDQLQIQILRDEGHKKLNPIVAETAHFNNAENETTLDRDIDRGGKVVFNQRNLLNQTQELSRVPLDKDDNYTNNFEDQVNIDDGEITISKNKSTKEFQKNQTGKIRPTNNSEQVNVDYIESARFGSHVGLDINGTDPMQSSMSQNMGQTVNQSHSIAQTPCFAETPNTTDQFKGYKIETKDRIIGLQNLQNINLVGSSTSNGGN